MSRESILAEVSAERERQDSLFGGACHDDTHSATDWVAILIRHLGLAVDDGSPAGVCFMNDHCAGADPARYRRQMVRVAAVAVAALETFDRKVGQEAGVLPAAPAAPAAPPAPAADDWWQRLADQLGESVLLLDRVPSVVQGQDRSSHLYAVRAAGATPWELANHLRRVNPSQKE